MVATQRTLSFDEAISRVYVAVRRGKDIVILKVKKVMTSFKNGMQQRVLILRDGSHYADDISFANRMWEVARV